MMKNWIKAERLRRESDRERQEAQRIWYGGAEFNRGYQAGVANSQVSKVPVPSLYIDMVLEEAKAEFAREIAKQVHARLPIDVIVEAVNHFGFRPLRVSLKEAEAAVVSYEGAGRMLDIRLPELGLRLTLPEDGQ